MTFPNDAEASLAEALAGTDPAWDDPPEAPPDPDRANELLHRLARLELEEARDARIAARQIAQVEAWQAGRSEIQRRRADWLRTSLAAYLEGVRRTTGVKSLSLPAGSLYSKQEPPTWTFYDEAAFLAWARENLPAAVRQKPPPPPEIEKAVAKTELTRRDEKGRPLDYGVSADGEIPPGLRVEPGGLVVTITLTGEDLDQ
jgi:hypothetical protein